MTRILASPGRYIQGPGELARIGDHLAGFEGPFLFVMGGYAYRNLKPVIEESCRVTGKTAVFEPFSGECTRTEIARLVKVAGEHGCRVTVGVGGGKALDTAKGVSVRVGGPVISIPTIASTDAPTSAIAVTYTEDHAFDGNILLPKNPEMVLVDTEVIAAAPVRFLVAGMGDALSTYFEARANAMSDHDNFVGGKYTYTSLALSRICYDILIRNGVKAKESAEERICTRELEHVIEANIYLSGVGFESNGLAGAHSIYNALTILPSCHRMYHGELVAFGTIVQLVLENQPEDEINEVIRFCISVGLPVTLADISETGLSREDLMAVATAACSPENFMDSEPFAVSPEMVYDAMVAADARGEGLLNQKG